MNVRGVVIAPGDLCPAFVTFVRQRHDVMRTILALNCNHLTVVPNIPRSDPHFLEFVPADVIECTRIA